MQEQSTHTAVAQRIVDNVSKVIIGKRPVIEHALAALIAQGHILIEDVPGVGKTMLAKSMSISVGCNFKRIQFTPDLLPSDVAGISVYNQASGEFQFRPGPIMSEVVLADEINRATPKTQSALLEAMEELQVTVDGETHHLKHPFVVMATQNPIEYEGTFPLPEAQLDRFLMRISLGYPEFEEELTVIEQQEHAHPIDTLEAVATPQDVIGLQEAAKEVYVDRVLREYIVHLTEATREHRDVSLGASPRATIFLTLAAKSHAFVQGRGYVTPQDVKSIAMDVLRHRVHISYEAEAQEKSSEEVVQLLLDHLPVP